MIARLAHRAWVATNRQRWEAFRHALKDAGGVQDALLKEYIRKNAGTRMGNRYIFAAIDSVSAFQRRIPIVTYDDLAQDIDLLRRGAQDILTRDPVLRLVPSSGSTASRKLIPYTRRSRYELQQAIGPWIADLQQRRPNALAGRAYWSVSPMAEPFDEEEASAVPIGFADDSAYLGGPAQRLVHLVLAVPPSVRHLEDIDEFRYTTWKYLLKARDLTLISIWHPSFLTLLLDALPDFWDKLLKDLPRRRAMELKRIGPHIPSKFWPDLEVISCWRDAHAAAPARQLDRLFPDVAVEAKGLLATEAVVTVPFEEKFPLAIRSHFFEFLDENDKPHLATELQVGGEYEVVVTTGGGLYRYRLGDRVRVTGFTGTTPELAFLGKMDRVSDRRGEKLNEEHVAACLNRLLEPLDLDVRFALLAPEEDGKYIAYYTLFLECDRPPPTSLAKRLDDALCENPHFRNCRKLGQLTPTRVQRIANGGHHVYIDYRCSGGQRLGDIKPTVLDIDTGWTERFKKAARR